MAEFTVSFDRDSRYLLAAVYAELIRSIRRRHIEHNLSLDDRHRAPDLHERSFLAAYPEITGVEEVCSPGSHPEDTLVYDEWVPERIDLLSCHEIPEGDGFRRQYMTGIVFMRYEGAHNAGLRRFLVKKERMLRPNGLHSTLETEVVQMNPCKADEIDSLALETA